MNKNKSHLYALMIHQANSSWLKSLRGTLGQNSATMPQCREVLKEPFSMALIKLILWAREGVLTWKSKQSTFTNSVFNDLVLVAWELIQAFLCTSMSNGAHSAFPVRETQQEKLRTWGKELPEKIKASITRHSTAPWKIVIVSLYL